MKQIEVFDIEKCIKDKHIKFVSFDVFDTLLVRPFFYPSDLFCLLDVYANQIVSITDKINFHGIRTQAEKLAREKTKCEDVTLEEIYSEVKEITGFPYDVIESIRKKELALEKKYLKPRNFSKTLYNLAKENGKKIIITSDMYLSKTFLGEVLTLSGYSGWEKLYVSSEIKKTKHHGTLYDYIINDLGIKPRDLLHIGDNYKTDILNAKKHGISTFYLPRTVDIMSNKAHGDFYSGDVFDNVYEKTFALHSSNVFRRTLGLRCMFAVVANRIFDNPFRPFNRNSDFNGEAELIGYFPFGMHLFDLTTWMHKVSEQEHFDQINFLARDGYLPMEAFKILNSVYKNNAKLNYVYINRRLLFPLQIQTEFDSLSLAMNLYIGNKIETNPKKVLGYLKAIIKPEVYENANAILKNEGIDYECNFKDVAAFYKFCRVFKNNFFSKEKSEEYRKTFERTFFPMFNGKCATYDVGYHLKIENALRQLFDWNVTPFYIHLDDDISLFRAKKSRIPVKPFYNGCPAVSYFIREIFFNKLEGSILSFKSENGIFKIDERQQLEYTAEGINLISTIQKNAISFVNDMVTIFTDDLLDLHFLHGDASFAFDFFLTHPKSYDKKLFSKITFEESIRKSESLSFEAFWNRQLESVLQTESFSSHIKQSLKSLLKNIPFLLFLVKYSCKISRKIFRVLKEKI